MGDKRWQRPESVQLPKIWRRCQGKKKMADGRIPNFIIQDVTEELKEDLIHHMTTHFMRDEPLCKSSGLKQDPVSVRELQALWRDLMKGRIAIVALVDEGPDVKPSKIAGANMLGVAYKGDIPKDSYEGTPMNKLVGIVNFCTQLDDVFHRYSVTEYMTAYGLSVAEEYRGQGLGLQLLRTRADVGRAVGLKATVTVFTAIESQRIASEAGFQTLAQIRFDAYRVNGSLVFTDINTEESKLMGMRLK